MENLPIILQNTFEINTRNSFEKFNELDEYHDNVLKAHDADPFAAARYAFYHPLSVAFVNKFTLWHSSKDVSQGNTQTVNEILDNVRGPFIEAWETAVKVVYPKGTARFKSLFPNLRKPFQKGSQANRITAIDTLIENIGSDAALASLKAEIQTVATDLTTAQGIKKGKFGLTDTLSAEVEVARVAAAGAMWKNFLDIASHHYQNPHFVLPFFNWEVLRPGEQKEFIITIKAGKIKFIAKRTLGADTPILVENMDIPTAELFCGETKEATSPAGSSISVDGGDTKTVAAQLIGNTPQTPYIIAKNLDANIDARIRIVIG